MHRDSQALSELKGPLGQLVRREQLASPALKACKEKRAQPDLWARRVLWVLLVLRACTVRQDHPALKACKGWRAQMALRAWREPPVRPVFRAWPVQQGPLAPKGPLELKGPLGGPALRAPRGPFLNARRALARALRMSALRVLLELREPGSWSPAL